VGATKEGGYGLIGSGEPRTNGVTPTMKTHRAAWLVTYGPVPEGMCVLHSCDNPPCCRPDHLFLGTLKENSEDRDRKGRLVTPFVPGHSHGMATRFGAQVRPPRELGESG
jgi:hypothetical protein